MRGESKQHLVEWDKVCVPMANGGLGISKLTIFNKALLGNGYGASRYSRIDFGGG